MEFDKETLERSEPMPAAPAQVPCEQASGMGRRGTYAWSLGWPALILIVVLGVFLPLVDWQGTLYLVNHADMGFAQAMGRSVFNGQAFGGSDVGTFWMIAVGLAYVWHESRRRDAQADRRGIMLGYLTFTFIFMGLGLVQPLKFLMGRARPFLVLEPSGTLPFTDWFMMGPHFFGTDYVFNGSFPSGHTSTMALTVTLLYVVRYGNDWPEGRKRLASVVVAILTVLGAGVMMAARSMSRHHWLSDTTMVVPLVCLVAHGVFFHILQVPQQLQAWRQGRASAQVRRRPRFLELRILLVCLGLVICVVMSLGACRALWRGEALWLLPGLLLGPSLAWVLWRRLQNWRALLLG